MLDSNKEYCIDCSKELHPLRTKHNSGMCNKCYLKYSMSVYLWIYGTKITILLGLLLFTLLTINN